MQPMIMTPDDDLSGFQYAQQYAPKICVDYLSHDWTQEDIWTSWKVMSKQKKEYSNGIRLENASWRTWAKQKYNLKTVNPNKLNWLKDSDVTWLYGPLHTAWSSMESPKIQKTEDNLNLMPPKSSPKSCLKKKTISEMLRPVIRVKSDSIINNPDILLYKRECELDTSDCETSSTCSSISGPTTPTSPLKTFYLPVERSASQSKKIQFNDCVEQCIAVESDLDLDDFDSDSTDSSDDGISIKKKKRDSLTTICKLAPTKLKEDRVIDNEYSNLYSKRQDNHSTPTTPDWMFDEDDEFDLDTIDFDDFDAAILSPPYYQSESIIPPPEAPNENDEEDDDILDKAIDIAVNGVQDIVHWCSGAVYGAIRRRIF